MVTFSNVYPRLVVADAAKAIDFYVAAFGARAGERHTGDDGRIIHAEITIGDRFTVAVKDEDDAHPAPTTLGGTPVVMALDVSDADAVAEAMLANGATVVYPVQDWDYGARAGRLADPSGHLWMVSQPL
jgi:PhnB protein